MEGWQICKSSVAACGDIRTGNAVIAHSVAYGVVSDSWMGDVAFIKERHNCGSLAILSTGHQKDLFQGLEKQKQKSQLALSFPWAEKLEFIFLPAKEPVPGVDKNLQYLKRMVNAEKVRRKLKHMCRGCIFTLKSNKPYFSQEQSEWNGHLIFKVPSRGKNPLEETLLMI